MKVFVTGGTGFVGGAVLRELLQRGHEPAALVREDTEKGAGHLPGEVEIVRGDVLGDDLAGKMKGAGAVIHLVGIIRAFPKKGVTFERLHVGATANVVRAMKQAGIGRLVHMSALGASAEGPTDYFRTKAAGELAVAASGLGWTAIKPSVIYGPGDEFINMLAMQVRLAPIVPVLGDGKYLLQPVSVKDVAQGFVKALDLPATIGKAYEVGGPEKISYDGILDEVGAALGKGRVMKAHFPLALMRPIVSVMENVPVFPVTNDQLEMLLMNNVTDERDFFEDMGIEAAEFGEGIREYLPGKD